MADNRIALASNVVVAHRGAWKKNKLPENSIASLQEAIALKCTGSEFDVRMTADDSLVINHDAHYNNLEIEKSTFSELSTQRLANGEPLPTLRSYLLAGLQNNKQTRLVLEIKPSAKGAERANYIVDHVMAVVKELNAEKYIVYISFDYNMLLRVIANNKNAQTQYLEGNKSPQELKKDGISGLDYHYSVFQEKPAWIDEAKKLHLTLNAWTVNDPALMDWLIAKNFNFITTNEPDLLFKKIQKEN